MKKHALLILLSASLAVSAASPDSLLDEAIKNPGGYNQMCAMPAPVKADVPLPIYNLRVSRHFNLSQKAAEKLLAHRDDVAKALAARLAAMDLAKLPPKPAPAKESPSFPPPSGFSPRSLSGVMLEIAMELKAIEALPGLLKVEAQLAAILAVAEKDTAAPVPVLEVDGISYPADLRTHDYVKLKDGTFDAKPKPNIREIEREQAILNCRVYQREILSVITRLLRDARFQPLLDSEIEKTFAAQLKKDARSEQLKDIKKAEDIPADERAFVKWDAIQNLPSMGPRAELPYTEKLRGQIREFATQFLAAKK